MLGNTTKPLMRIREQLEDRGIDLVLFHANGAGGTAMEEAIDQFEAIVDYTLSEIAAEVAGGFPPAAASSARGCGTSTASRR